MGLIAVTAQVKQSEEGGGATGQEWEEEVWGANRSSEASVIYMLAGRGESGEQRELGAGHFEPVTLRQGRLAGDLGIARPGATTLALETAQCQIPCCNSNKKSTITSQHG